MVETETRLPGQCQACLRVRSDVTRRIYADRKTAFCDLCYQIDQGEVLCERCENRAAELDAKGEPVCWRCAERDWELANAAEDCLALESKPSSTNGESTWNPQAMATS